MFEQAQLIAELRMIQKHLTALEQEIAQVVAECREGQILRSIPAIGLLQAAAILATIGTIANFRSAAALKAYFGWAPTITQSGTTLNASSLTKGGSRMMKQTMYLIAWQAVRTETEWVKTYQRLVPLKCQYDDRLQAYKGRGKVLGRIAGAIISTIYALLRTDYERMSHLAPGAKPPEPTLYDVERHHQHRTGHYVPLHGQSRGNRMVLHEGS